MADDGRHLRGIISMEHFLARYRRLNKLKDSLNMAEQILEKGLIPKSNEKEHKKEITRLRKEITIERKRINDKNSGGSFEGAYNSDGGKLEKKKAGRKPKAKGDKPKKESKEDCVDDIVEDDEYCLRDRPEENEDEYEYNDITFECDEEVDLDADMISRWSRLKDEEH